MLAAASPIRTALARLAGAMSLALVPISASAQTGSEDVQVWTFITIAAPPIGNVKAKLDLYGGLTDDAKRASQFLFRPSVAYKLNDKLSLGGGYAYLRIDPKGVAGFSEHRSFQQAQFTFFADNSGPQLSTTTRLEQRFREGRDGTGWRLRHQTRLDLPVSRHRPGKIVFWNETFYSLNSNDWAGRSGISAMINFVGVSVPLTNKVTFEPGYLNFRVIQSGPDTVNHVAGIFFAVAL